MIVKMTVCLTEVLNPHIYLNKSLFRVTRCPGHVIIIIVTNIIIIIIIINILIINVRHYN